MVLIRAACAAQGMLASRTLSVIRTVTQKSTHKDIGMCNVAQVLDGLEACSLKLFCGLLSMPKKDIAVMLTKVRQEQYACKFHAQLDL